MEREEGSALGHWGEDESPRRKNPKTIKETLKFYVPARVTLKRMLQQQQQPILIDVAFSDVAEGSVGSILAHPFDELDWHFNRLLTVGGVYSMSA